jgi:hypothetical protein
MFALGHAVGAKRSDGESVGCNVLPLGDKYIINRAL